MKNQVFRTNTANRENLRRQPNGIPAFQLALGGRAHVFALEARRAGAIARHILFVQMRVYARRKPRGKNMALDRYHVIRREKLVLESEVKSTVRLNSEVIG